MNMDKDYWNYGIIGMVILGAMILFNKLKEPKQANVASSCGCGKQA